MCYKCGNEEDHNTKEQIDVLETDESLNTEV